MVKFISDKMKPFIAGWEYQSRSSVSVTTNYLKIKFSDLCEHFMVKTKQKLYR